MKCATLYMTNDGRVRGPHFLRKNRKWSEETKILNLKKKRTKNEGNKMIIIWLSFSNKQTNKKKEKSVCPKGFLLSLTTSDFFSSTRPTSVHWKSLQVE